MAGGFFVRAAPFACHADVMPRAPDGSEPQDRGAHTRLGSVVVAGAPERDGGDL